MRTQWGCSTIQRSSASAPLSACWIACPAEASRSISRASDFCMPLTARIVRAASIIFLTFLLNISYAGRGELFTPGQRGRLVSSNRGQGCESNDKASERHNGALLTCQRHNWVIPLFLIIFYFASKSNFMYLYHALRLVDGRWGKLAVVGIRSLGARNSAERSSEA